MGLGISIRTVGLALVALLCVPAWGGDSPAPPPELAPAMRIPVAPMGYLPPSTFYLTYRLSSESLGFFDDSHLLFTFRIVGLLRRIPGDPPDDDDQQIHAVVLDLATGRIVQQADWRMHDRSQYLWPFAGGKFLVRIRDSLYLTDQSLRLEPYLRLDAPLRSVQVSPDRRWMVVETDDPAKSQDKPVDSESLGTGKPVRVVVVAAGSNRAVLESQARNPVSVPMLGDSVLNTLEGKQLSAWVIRAIPLHGEPRTLAEIKSGCEPGLQPVSAGVMLAMGCFSSSDDRPVVAISAGGEELWRQTWQTKYVWPWFASAENGSRFAYESVEIKGQMSSIDALYPEDVVRQLVGVYDTQTGKLVLVRDCTPVLSAGQNVALSPDGMHFAVLRNGAIEIYNLPPVEARAAVASKSAERPRKK